MRLISVLLASMLALCATARSQTPPRPISTTALARCETLRQAYNSPDPASAFDAYFQAWHQRGIRPPADTARAAMDDTLRAAYDLFETYFDRLEQERSLIQLAYMSDVYRPTKYLVLTDAFGVAVSSEAALFDTLKFREGGTEEFYELKYPLNFTYDRFSPHFRPHLSDRYRGLDLYLTSDESGAFNCFIGSDFTEGSIFSIPVPDSTNQVRANTLKSFVTVLPGHWGGYWLVETQPSVISITFGSDLRTAIVSFQLVYALGYAYFERVGDRWIFRREELTGSE